MQSSQYGRCKRNMDVKESSTLLLQIWKKHLIEYPERSLDGLLRKAGVDEWLVNTVMAMYEGAQTVVRKETQGI